MTEVVTVVLSGIPNRRHREQLLNHLARYLNKQLEHLDIGTFRLRETTGVFAIDFSSGYDAIEAQNLLDGRPYTLDDGIVHVLRAKVTHDPELMSEYPLPENRLVLYRDDHSGARSHRDLKRTEREIQAQINMLKIKRKVMMTEEYLLERERHRLSRELEEMSQSDEDTAKKKKKKKKSSRKKHRSSTSSSDDSSSSDSSVERRARKRKLMAISPEILRLEREVHSLKRDTSSQARASTSRDTLMFRPTPSRATINLKTRIRPKSGRSRSRSRRSISRSRRSTSRSRQSMSRSRRSISMSRRSTSRSRTRRSRSRARLSQSRSRRSQSRSRRSPSRIRRSRSRSHRSTSRSRPLKRQERSRSPSGRERSLNPVKRNYPDQNLGSSSQDTRYRRSISRAIEYKMERLTPKGDANGRNQTTMERETTVKNMPQKRATLNSTDIERKKQGAVKEILLILQKPLDILCYNESTTDTTRRRVLSKVFVTTRNRMEDLDVDSSMNVSDIVTVYNTRYSNTEEELAKLFSEVISAQCEAQDPLLNDIDDILQGLDVDLLAEDVKPKIECDDEELEEGEITNIVINIVPTRHPEPTPDPPPSPGPPDYETFAMEDNKCGYYVHITVPTTTRKKYFLLKKKLLQQMNEHILKVKDYVDVKLISYILMKIIEQRMNELLVGVTPRLKTMAIVEMYRVRYPKEEDKEFVDSTLCAIWRGEYNDSENGENGQPPEAATSIVKQEKLDEAEQEEQKQTKIKIKKEPDLIVTKIEKPDPGGVTTIAKRPERTPPELKEPTVVVKKGAPIPPGTVGGIKKKPTVIYVSDDEGAKGPKVQNNPKARQDAAVTGGARSRVKLETFDVDDSDDEKDSTVQVKQKPATTSEIKKERNDFVEVSDDEKEPTVVVKKEAPVPPETVAGINKEPAVIYVSDDESAKGPKAQSNPKARQDAAATGGARPLVVLDTFLVDDSDDEKDTTVQVKQKPATTSEIKKERNDFVEVSDDENTRADVEAHSNDSTETILIANEPVNAAPVTSTDNDNLTALLGIDDTNVETIERIEEYIHATDHVVGTM